jgi:glycosyltransferase involved in cell wall biosynthesis
MADVAPSSSRFRGITVVKNETILCNSPEVWNGMWRERQQIMSRLARDNRVLFIEPERDVYKSYADSLWCNLRRLPCLKTNPISTNLTVYSGPPSLPYAATMLPSNLLQITSPIVAAINCQSMYLHALRILAKEGVTAPILWLFEPRYVGLVGKLGERIVCYYVYDEIAEFHRNARHKAFIERCDQAMTKKADIVFTSSRSQYERRRYLNPNTHFTPHGVDFDHYSKALDPKMPVPEDVTGIKKPIVGYIGLLSRNLDAELLLQVAEMMPDWSLVLAGPDDFPSQGAYLGLRAQANVHFLGRKDIGIIPNYLKAFDVAILPYRTTEHTKYAYPCKLHEYLASGKPVVAAPLPELVPFKDIIEFAQSPGEFVQRIRQALTNDSPDRIEKRLAKARQNTWDQRVAIMKVIIDLRLSLESADA